MERLKVSKEKVKFLHDSQVYQNILFPFSAEKVSSLYISILELGKFFFSLIRLAFDCNRIMMRK